MYITFKCGNIGPEIVSSDTICHNCSMADDRNSNKSGINASMSKSSIVYNKNING